MYDEELQYNLQVADANKLAAIDALSKQIITNPTVMGAIVQYSIAGCSTTPVGTIERWLRWPLSLLEKYGVKIDSMIFMRHEDKTVKEGLLTYDVLFNFIKQNASSFEDNAVVDATSATDKALAIAAAAYTAAQKALEKATTAAAAARAAHNKVVAIAADTNADVATIEAATAEVVAAAKAAEEAATEAIAANETANKAFDAADDARWGNSIIVNVEIQRKFNPGYWLPNRCVYYISRMMSRQSGTEFANIKYDQIKRVYSIWICFDPPDGLKNRGKLYTLNEQDLSHLPGYFIKTIKALNIVLIGVQGPDADNYQGIFRLLDTLFTTRYNWEKKLEILEKEFGFKKPPTDFVEKLKLMSDIGLGIFQDGKAEGKAETVSLFDLIMDKFIAGSSLEDILTLPNVAEEDRPLVRKIFSRISEIRK